MKIAYIALKGMPGRGGVEKLTEEVGLRLAGRGHEVLVYGMAHYGMKEGFFRGMRLKTVPTVKSRSLEKIVSSFTATLRHCIEEDADIVHFHAFGPAMFSLLPRLMGRKVVVQGHGLEWKRAKWGAAGRLFLRLSEIPSVLLPHRVTVVSEVQRRYLRERYGIESVLIPTGVNPPRFESPDMIKKFGLEGKDYILFASRLVREKGAHCLIEAFKRARTGLKLVIAGDAGHEEAYKAELRKMAEGRNDIVFTGFATGRLLDELFTNCFLFVQPSETEGLPTSLLEAMSYGNCCLSSDIPENIEAMKSHGYTFECGNVKELAEKLDALSGNLAAVESVKAKARVFVLGSHSWDDIALRHEALYSELMGGK